MNDLYATSTALPPEAHSDPVHYYTPLGTEAFANKVPSFITPALCIHDTLEYKEDLYTDQPIGI